MMMVMNYDDEVRRWGICRGVYGGDDGMIMWCVGGLSRRSCDWEGRWDGDDCWAEGEAWLLWVMILMVMVMMIYIGKKGGVWLGLVIRVSFFLSSLNFFSLKTSSSSPTLEILAQTISSFLSFLDRLLPKHAKPEPQRLVFSSLLKQFLTWKIYENNVN